MNKEKVDADLKAFLDILSIACEVLQVAGHQTLVEKLGEKVNKLGNTLKELGREAK